MTLTLTVPPRTNGDRLTGLPVAVIGAGPVGLAAAAHLLERGLPVVVYEAGPAVGTSVRAWGHTRLFSPWQYVIDPAAQRLLEATGWEAPRASSLPTGHDLVDTYLVPLAATPQLAPVIQYGTRVEAVSRQGMDRTRSTGRADTPFLLRLHTADGTHDVTARAVVDTSGTYTSPNPLTAAGLAPASDLGDRVVHALPDVLGTDRARFAGKRVLVVGAGHSAANTLIKLASLAKTAPGTDVLWAVRNAGTARLGTDAADGLAARGQLGSTVHGLVESGQVQQIASYEIDDVRPDGDQVTVTGRRAGETFAVTVDVIVNATGFRPGLDMLREVRLGLDDIVEAPRALAPLIDPNLHSCGSVPPHGVAELAHPEPNFFIAGMKSYGRAPTFLLLTGYEQVRSIAADLAGDHAAARLVELVLPETGVCSTDIGGSSSCCTTPAAAATPNAADTACCAAPEPTPAADSGSCCAN
ncbi:NAD(P)-binding domain-containing protein [Curtobacterium sp. MCSS17_015]|uniref:NAD(P)-binding domain-containing protein n=1 Tax=Curtobacterium sp. MCSS17_015 TaxID=2175666 RepID=UPI000DA96275|nr:NAD(P)-binding domain-containing protein [Curtobacterium sp. MCSS17_015]WIB25697.1 FAD-dependent oxidoreductase [Curtobacterium sp. MCSS17_015]